MQIFLVKEKRYSFVAFYITCQLRLNYRTALCHSGTNSKMQMWSWNSSMHACIRKVSHDWWLCNACLQMTVAKPFFPLRMLTSIDFAAIDKYKYYTLIWEVEHLNFITVRPQILHSILDSPLLFEILTILMIFSKTTLSNCLPICDPNVLTLNYSEFQNFYTIDANRWANYN